MDRDAFATLFSQQPNIKNKTAVGRSSSSSSSSSRGGGGGGGGGKSLRGRRAAPSASRRASNKRPRSADEGSRFVECPLCGRSIHCSLAQAHVERCAGKDENTGQVLPTPSQAACGAAPSCSRQREKSAPSPPAVVVCGMSPDPRRPSPQGARGGALAPTATATAGGGIGGTTGGSEAVRPFAAEVTPSKPSGGIPEIVAVVASRAAELGRENLSMAKPPQTAAAETNAERVATAITAEAEVVAETTEAAPAPAPASAPTAAPAADEELIPCLRVSPANPADAASQHQLGQKGTNARGDQDLGAAPITTNRQRPSGYDNKNNTAANKATSTPPQNNAFSKLMAASALTNFREEMYLWGHQDGTLSWGWGAAGAPLPPPPTPPPSLADADTTTRSGGGSKIGASAVSLRSWSCQVATKGPEGRKTSMCEVWTNLPSVGSVCAPSTPPTGRLRGGARGAPKRAAVGGPESGAGGGGGGVGGGAAVSMGRDDNAGLKAVQPGRSLSRLSVAVVKSMLQKNVRRGRAEAAARCALELGLKSWSDVIRRVLVVIVEDSLLHPAAPFLTWLMVATSKGYRPPPILLDAFLRVVYETAACPVRDTTESCFLFLRPQRRRGNGGSGGGDGSGSGNGRGNRKSNGKSDGDGNGYSNGNGNGYSYSNGYSNGYSSGNGSGYGNVNGYSNDNGYSNGNGNGNGYSNGSGNGYSNGSGNGYSNGYSTGYSNGKCNSDDGGNGNGEGNSHSTGNGNSSDSGSGSGGRGGSGGACSRDDGLPASFEADEFAAPHPKDLIFRPGQRKARRACTSSRGGVEASTEHRHPLSAATLPGREKGVGGGEVEGGSGAGGGTEFSRRGPSRKERCGGGEGLGIFSEGECSASAAETAAAIDAPPDSASAGDAAATESAVADEADAAIACCRRSLLMRASYGGMPFDRALLKGACLAWGERSGHSTPSPAGASDRAAFSSSCGGSRGGVGAGVGDDGDKNRLRPSPPPPPPPPIFNARGAAFDSTSPFGYVCEKVVSSWKRGGWAGFLAAAHAGTGMPEALRWRLMAHVVGGGVGGVGAVGGSKRASKRLGEGEAGGGRARGESGEPGTDEAIAAAGGVEAEMEVGIAEPGGLAAAGTVVEPTAAAAAAAAERQRGPIMREEDAILSGVDFHCSSVLDDLLRSTALAARVGKAVHASPAVTASATAAPAHGSAGTCGPRHSGEKQEVAEAVPMPVADTAATQGSSRRFGDPIVEVKQAAEQAMWACSSGLNVRRLQVAFSSGGGGVDRERMSAPNGGCESGPRAYLKGARAEAIADGRVGVLSGGEDVSETDARVWSALSPHVLDWTRRFVRARLAPGAIMNAR